MLLVYQILGLNNDINGIVSLYVENSIIFSLTSFRTCCILKTRDGRVFLILSVVMLRRERELPMTSGKGEPPQYGSP